MAKSLVEQAKDLTDANVITPTTQAYDESQGVEGRANRIASSGSPLMQAAETRGLQAAAKRGLTQSSIGIESAQKAVLDSAVPIATADASLSSTQSLANQAARNNASTANAQLGVGAGSAAMGLESQERQQGLSLAQQAKQFDTTTGQTQQQIENQKAQFAKSLELQQAGLAQQGKQFDVTSGQTQQQIAQAQQQIDSQREQFAQQLGMTVQDLALRRDSLNANQQQFLAQLDQQQQQLKQQQGQFEASLTANQGNFAAELGQKQKQFDAAQLQQQVLANLDAETRLKMASMDAASRADIQGSVNVSNAWGQMMQNIQAIQNNANLDPSTKTTLINNNMESFKAFASAWKKTEGIDLGPLLNFNIVGPSAAPPVVQDPNQAAILQSGLGGFGGVGGEGPGSTGSSASIGASPGGFGGDGF